MSVADARSAVQARIDVLLAQHARVVKAVAREGEALAEEDDSEERGVMLEAEDVMTRLEVHERVELEQLHRALERMDTGSWGTCATCGEAISAPRLQVLPWAERCTACADAG